MSPALPKLRPALQQRIDRARSDGRTAIALLDVDLTLVDNAPRNRAIWSDWAHSVRGRWDGADEAMVAAQTMPMVFGVMDNLRTLGVTSQELLDDGLRFWLKAFFSDDYCRRDTPLPGAVKAVLALRAADVTIAYVTARTANMVPGTVSSMGKMGFPIGVSGTILATKPNHDMKDNEHKASTCEWLSGLGEAVLCADNEPAHVNTMHARFPHALSVLVDTRCSPNPPPLAPGASRSPSLLEATCAHA